MSMAYRTASSSGFESSSTSVSIVAASSTFVRIVSGAIARSPMLARNEPR